MSDHCVVTVCLLPMSNFSLLRELVKKTAIATGSCHTNLSNFCQCNGKVYWAWVRPNGSGPGLPGSASPPSPVFRCDASLESVVTILARSAQLRCPKKERQCLNNAGCKRDTWLLSMKMNLVTWIFRTHLRNVIIILNL